mmetsp:Transcript_97172/g.274688  ORF Transcript_97172/g.274688 Transcript_97172/m.274688 type:complete len:208 (+) Transcript_97172:429-1052(+)
MILFRGFGRGATDTFDQELRLGPCVSAHLVLMLVFHPARGPATRGGAAHNSAAERLGYAERIGCQASQDGGVQCSVRIVRRERRSASENAGRASNWPQGSVKRRCCGFRRQHRLLVGRTTRSTGDVDLLGASPAVVQGIDNVHGLCGRLATVTDSPTGHLRPMLGQLVIDLPPQKRGTGESATRCTTQLLQRLERITGAMPVVWIQS